MLCLKMTPMKGYEATIGVAIWICNVERSLFGFNDLKRSLKLSIGEEVKNFGVAVPRSMIIPVFLNGLFAFGFMTAILFGIGDVLGAVYYTPQLRHRRSITHTATRSKWATSTMTVDVMFSLASVIFACFASASKVTWAFAPDNGLLFSYLLQPYNVSH